MEGRSEVKARRTLLRDASIGSKQALTILHRTTIINDRR